MRHDDIGSPLASARIGTSRRELIDACSEVLRASEPPPTQQGYPVALAFSGGGFRATLSALGVLRFVADAGLLGRVRYVSSVSGGSLANGLFAHHYEDLQRNDFTSEALDAIVIVPFLKKVTRRSLSRALVANVWRTFGPRTRTDLLADIFDKWFFKGRLLEDLSSQCRFMFNAASVTTGVRFVFEHEIVGDWVMGRAYTKGSELRVAQAAAASAAVPGAFAPFVVKNVDFPCANGRTQMLLDGGAYDNSGLEALDNVQDALIVALNAGGLLRTGVYRGLPIIKDLQRANSLLYRQSTALRFRDAVGRFKAFESAEEEGREPPEDAQRGVLFGLASTIDDAPWEWTEGRDEDRSTVNMLAGYKTSFDRFPRDVCEKLIYRGWWLAGAALSAYHRAALPDRLPTWRELR